MSFEYIDENLISIIEHPETVLYLRPYDIGKNRALFAMVREEPGVYRKVQITKEIPEKYFPFDPIDCFYNGPGYFYLKDFIVYKNHTLALNTMNLDGFKTKLLDDNRFFKVGIYATFSDGTATYVWREREKRFEKQGGLQPYIELLKQYKPYEPKHDYYRCIESHYETEDGVFVIPELQHANDSVETLDSVDQPKQFVKKPNDKRY